MAKHNLYHKLTTQDIDNYVKTRSITIIVNNVQDMAIDQNKIYPFQSKELLD